MLLVFVYLFIYYCVAVLLCCHDDSMETGSVMDASLLSVRMPGDRLWRPALCLLTDQFAASRINTALFPCYLHHEGQTWVLVQHRPKEMFSFPFLAHSIK